MDKRNAALDLLRFAAAFVVAVPHLIIFYKGSAHTEHLEILTSMSVEVFFALSGFVLAPLIFDIVASERNVMANTRVFFIRRWMRTLPLFYFSAFLHFVIFDPQVTLHTLSYFAFLQNFAWGAPAYDYFAVSWSLAIEEWFYVALPMFLIICRRWFTGGRPLGEDEIFRFTAAFIAIFIALKIAYPVDGAAWGAELRRVTVFRLDAIAYGGLTYLLVKRGAAIVRPIPLALSLPVQAVLVFHIYTRILSGEAGYLEANVLVFVISATFSCSLVAIFHALDRVFPDRLRAASIWGGRISYGVYLFHIPVGVLAQILIPDGGFGVAVQIAAATAVLSVFTALIYQYFERPILMNRPRFIDR